MTEAAVDTRPDTARAGRRERLSSPAIAWAACGLLLVVGGIFLLYETHGTTWWFDEWTWALHRRGSSISTYLAAHAGHLVLVPLVIYKALFATAGLHHYAPYRIVLVVCQLALIAVVFEYARRRVELFIALLVAALLMFFGPGWQDILWPFQIGWLISIACGIGALLLLDREDTFGRVGACVLLVISIACISMGVAIAIGIVVELVVRRGWRQLWVVGVPIVLYGLWSLGHQDSSVTAHSISQAPDFAATMAAATAAAVVGLGSPVQHGLNPDSGTLLQWGPPVLVAIIALFTWRLFALGRVPVRVITLLVIVGSFWLLVGVDRTGGSQAFESRYLYAGAIFILLIAVELLRGVRLSWPARGVIGAIALAVLVTNISVLRSNAGFLRQQAELTKAQTGGLDITRGIVAPNFGTGPLNAITAGPYFAAQRALGSPASTPAEIAADSELTREQVDAELAMIHQIGMQPAGPATPTGPAPVVDGTTGGSVRTAGSCRIFTPTPFAGGTTPTATVSATLPSSGLSLRTTGGEADIAYRRFAAAFQGLGVVKPGIPVEMKVTADLAPQLWHLQITPAGPTRVCSL